MTKKKTALTQEHVTMFLLRQLAGEPENIQHLVEGEESQLSLTGRMQSMAIHYLMLQLHTFGVPG